MSASCYVVSTILPCGNVRGAIAKHWVELFLKYVDWGGLRDSALSTWFAFDEVTDDTGIEEVLH